MSLCEGVDPLGSVYSRFGFQRTKTVRPYHEGFRWRDTCRL